MIERAEHEDNFTVVTNEIIKDTRLSDSAFRMLIYMLSCSDSWSFSIGGLSSVMGWSERKTARIVTDLKKLGYIEQKLQSDAKGRFIPSAWVVHEDPLTARPKNRSAVKTAERLEPQSGGAAIALTPQSGKMAPLINTNIVTNTNSKKDKGIKKDVRFVPPSIDEVKAYCEERQNGLDAEHFVDYYTSKGWKVGKSPMKDWRSAVRTWERNSFDKPKAKVRTESTFESPFDKFIFGDDAL